MPSFAHSTRVRARRSTQCAHSLLEGGVNAAAINTVVNTEMHLIKPEVLSDAYLSGTQRGTHRNAISDDMADLTKPNILAASKNFSWTPNQITAREVEHA